ncbi:MAG: (2Fe-2S) ferredoxin domain-containing protein [Bacillota bacterium]
MITINVCVGTACHKKGAYSVIYKLQSIIKEKNLGKRTSVNKAFCFGQCSQSGISVKIENNARIYYISEETIERFLEEEVMPLIQ